jgi:hypothetical protein
MSSSAVRLPKQASRSLRQRWSVVLGARPRGLALAREAGWLLAWDEHHWLYLFNRRGERQAQARHPGVLVAAACADDGSAYAAVGDRGEVVWLAPDLSPRWERALPSPAVAVALDPFGQYVAAGDTQGRLYLFDYCGRPLAQSHNPRPLHHLAFVPAAPLLVGAADFGLVAGFDLTARCLWQDRPFVHIGSLAASGDGSRIVLACFTDGLRLYTRGGQKLGRQTLPEPCQMACLAFDGRLSLAASIGHNLFLLDRDGKTLGKLALEQPLAALALGPLGETGVAALADGTLLGLDLNAAPAGP